MSAKRSSVPTVSRVFDDSVLVELLFDSAAGTTSLAIRAADGRIAVSDHLNLANGERLVPYAPSNNLLARGCVLLPSGVGPLLDKSELVAEIAAFLDRYVHLTPLFGGLAAHYVLLSWVHDAFNELPYLRFRGDFGTGKTRALMAVGALCYKPFFASGASTVSPIFHVLDAFGGTLVLDEADLRFSDATAQLTKILNNGNVKGVPVLRTMTNRDRELNPTAFRVFGPKLVAMRESFRDDALESRFLTEETNGRAVRNDIPISLPEAFRREALELRNELLAWRLNHLHEIATAPERAAAGVHLRLSQSSLALLSLIDDPALRDLFTTYLQAEDARWRELRSETEEAAVLRALLVCMTRSGGRSVRLTDIAAELKATSRAEGVPPTPRRIASILRERLRIATTRSNGVFVVPPAERPRVEALAARFGLSAAA